MWVFWGGATETDHHYDRNQSVQLLQYHDSPHNNIVTINLWGHDDRVVITWYPDRLPYSVHSKNVNSPSSSDEILSGVACLCLSLSYSDSGGFNLNMHISGWVDDDLFEASMQSCIKPTIHRKPWSKWKTNTSTRI